MFKYVFFLCLTLAITGLTSCSLTSTSSTTEEISLKADRSSLDDLRSETPEPVKEENDFLALVLRDMAAVEKKPQQVRDRYFREVRRTRDQFNKDHRRQRDEFSRNEKSKREKFLKSLKDERTAFIAKKPSREQSSAFYQEQNLKRNNYFQDQSDRRRDFDSKMSNARKDFNDDMALKQKQFDDAYREYLKKYREEQARLKQAASAPPPPPMPTTRVQAPSPASYPGQAEDLAEFDNLKSKKRINLSAGGE